MWTLTQYIVHIVNKTQCNFIVSSILCILQLLLFLLNNDIVKIIENDKYYTMMIACNLKWTNDSILNYLKW
jgi:hypothetical protein